MKDKKINKNTLLLCFIVFIEMLFIKFIQYKVFPIKYFYDSTSILNKTLYSFQADKAYTFTANFYKAINIFKFNTLSQWSWFLGIIFTIILCLVLLKNKKYNLTQSIFIIVSVFFLNLYVFNISKDLIQFIIFLFIYFILNSQKLSNIKKLIISSLILSLEAYYFRVYYLLMAIIMIDIYFVYSLFFKNKKINNKKKIKIIVLSMIVLFAEIFVVQLISSDNYTSIMLARSNVNAIRENSTDAVTIINDPFGINYNYLTFICNYVVNFLRLLFPVELITKGYKYILFIIYQVFISINLIKSVKKINQKNALWIITAISFIMISTIFEPDFGSFIRHESALLPILLQINILTSNKERKEENNEKMYNI